MLLLPYGTDAPIYRIPKGTLSLILANCILYFLQDVVIPESIYLSPYGSGYTPIQWVFSSFAHSSLEHLIGNMIFLFVFGIIVESMMKLRHYLMLYFGIVILENFLSQTIMWNGHGASLGASSVIFGLMMTACICAPEKNVKWFGFFYFTWAVWEIPVLINGLFYFMWDFSLAMFTDFVRSTPLLHCVGGVSGMIVALIGYRFGIFELDGEDAISRFREILGKEPIISEAHKNRLSEAENARNRVKPRTYKFGPLKPQLAKMNSYLNDGRYKLALMKYRQLRDEHGKFQLTEPQLIRFINLGTANKAWPMVVKFMNQYLARFQQHQAIVLLNRARIEALETKEIQQARRTLKRVSAEQLSPKSRKMYLQLRNYVQLECA